VNISLGTYGGPHDGTNHVELAFDGLVKEVDNEAHHYNRAVVISAGNSYEHEIHKSGKLTKDGVTARSKLTWEISKGDLTYNEMGVWYSGKDEFSCKLIPPKSVNPKNFKSKPIGLGNSGWVVDESKNGLAYVSHRKDIINEANVIHILQNPRFNSASDALWTVQLDAVKIAENGGQYHAWIERDHVDARHDYRSSFVDDVDDNACTIGSLASGEHSIVVGSYNAHHREAEKPISHFSSAGPTRDGREKPNLSAAGHYVSAACSSTVDGVISKSGTSMAAPAMTGMVALLFAEALRRNLKLPIDKTMKILKGSANLSETLQKKGITWDARRGWGGIKVDDMMAHVLLTQATANIQQSKVNVGEVLDYQVTYLVNPSVAPIIDYQETTVSVFVADDRRVKDVAVGVNINHTFRGDFRFSVYPPYFPEIILHNKTGGSANNLVEVYDSNKHDGLKTFVTKSASAQGDWQFRVADTASGDGGKINQIKLMFTFFGTGNSSLPKSAKNNVKDANDNDESSTFHH